LIYSPITNKNKNIPNRKQL